MPDLLIVLEGHSQKTKKGYKNLKEKDIFSKYAGVILLKDKIGIAITNAFQKILDGPNRKRNKIWARKYHEFYNRSMKSWLAKNYIEIYSTNNKRKITCC